MERSLKIDWFAFTTRRPLQEVIALFGRLDVPMEVKDRGLHGYHHHFSFGGLVSVLYSMGRDDINIQIPGSGCARFSYMEILLLLSPGDKVSRCDIALDCRNSGFTCADIWGYLQRGWFCSVSSAIRKLEWLVQGPERGYTIYIGSSQSERMVRIYDKGKESGQGGDWVRYEVQLRGASANAFVVKLLADAERFQALSMGLLSKQIRLILPGGENDAHNKHRTRNIAFWDELTDAVKPVSLVCPKSSKRFVNLSRYAKNAAATIKTLKLCVDGFSNYYHDLLDEVQLKPHHMQFVEEQLLHDNPVERDYMETFPMQLKA